MGYYIMADIMFMFWREKLNRKASIFSDVPISQVADFYRGFSFPNKFTIGIFHGIISPPKTTLWQTNSLLLNMAIEIVDFSIKHMVVFPIVM